MFALLCSCILHKLETFLATVAFSWKMSHLTHVTSAVANVVMGMEKPLATPSRSGGGLRARGAPKKPLGIVMRSQIMDLTISMVKNSTHCHCTVTFQESRNSGILAIQG